MPAPFTTPVAQSVPFEPNRNPGFGGVPSGLQSENVQDAIEEAKNDALSNDRYILLCSYSGKANTGRYLEFFPGINSSEAPIDLPVSSKLLTVVAAASALVTATLSFYNLAVSSTVPVYSVVFNNEKLKVISATPETPLYIFPANSQIAVKVSAGSFNKPRMYFFLSSST